MLVTVGRFNYVLSTTVMMVWICVGGGGSPWTMTTTGVEGARILAVEPVGGMSHWNFMSGVIRALVDRGHDVTAFTPFPRDEAGGGGNLTRGNYTEVDISGDVETVRDADLEDMVRQWNNPIDMVNPLVVMNRETCDIIYRHPEMERILRQQPPGDASSADPQRFDAILIEPILSECVSYVANRLRLPLIYSIPGPAAGMVQRYSTGHFVDPAVQSHALARHAIPRTFTQRMTNALMLAYWEVARVYLNLWYKRDDPKEFDSVDPVPPSLLFVNGHLANSASSAVPAEIVNIGGIHLKPAGDLPRDILEFIEQSPHGVICFTFGSTTKMSSLPDHLKKAFLEVLAQVPQRVLLKYENDLEEKPKNIMTLKWLPQRDILVHPNVKLFISHGGISGLYEAVDAGVPVLGFPLFADQHRNIDSLVDTGMAISMDLLTATKDVFLNNVLKLLNNEKYTKNAKIASEIFKDRPLSPSEQVVYWTEYVIRHKGAPHLKSHALNLTWYQYYLLDVIAVVLILVFVVFFMAYKILKSIIKYVLNSLRNVKTKSE